MYPTRLSTQWLCGKIAGHSLVNWYQQCVTVSHVPKFMSCHKDIVVVTGRAHCFHDCVYVIYINISIKNSILIYECIICMQYYILLLLSFALSSILFVNVCIVKDKD